MNKSSESTAGADAAGAWTASAKPRHNRKPVEAKLAELKRRLLEISDLAAAEGLLDWDQSTYMPRKGAQARARQIATVGRLAHEKSADRALGKLLDDLAPYASGLPYDCDDASLIRIARRDFEKAIKLPTTYVGRASELCSASYNAWTRARPANDFASMVPFLEKAIDLSREYAGFFAPYEHIADPLIDAAEDGMTAAAIGSLFAGLRRELIPLVRAICDQPLANDDCLHGSFSERAQLDFSLSVVKRFGYDLDRGRLDKTHHPFCTKFSSSDVRITTRVDENHLGDALFSILHESGHALGSGTSAGVHESQSRLWENVVGRSRAFWEHFYPPLRDAFPEQFGQIAFETFYRAINKVQRSLIRTDADEVTYNLHIMMRFDLELELLEGHLRVKDLPEAWRARTQADLGLVPTDDRDGCLQDVHWYAGTVGGGFQSYTLGNILSAQFYAAALKTHPGIPGEIALGEFGSLHGWLRENLYQHGRKFSPSELVMSAAGGPMSTKPYLAYLREKYGELYRLPSSAFGSVDLRATDSPEHSLAPPSARN
jgi:carboxypeptidase Taq